MSKLMTSLVVLAVIAAMTIQPVSADEGDENNSDEEYDDTYSMNFANDTYNEFLGCLCEGRWLECRAILMMEDRGIIVQEIQRNITFHGEGQTCRYFRCQFSESGLELGCDQLGQQAACGMGQISQFLPTKQLCCDPACVSLVWVEPDYDANFTGQSNLEECKTCSCPTEEIIDDTLSVTNVATGSMLSEETDTPAAISTLRLKDVLSVNTTEGVKTTTTTQTGGKTAHSLTNNSSQLLALNTTDDLTGGSTANNLTNMTAQLLSSDNTATITGAIVIVCVIVIVIVIISFIAIKRSRKRRRCLRLDRGHSSSPEYNEEMAMFQPDQTHGSSCVNGKTTVNKNHDDIRESGGGDINSSPIGGINSSPVGGINSSPVGDINSSHVEYSHDNSLPGVTSPPDNRWRDIYSAGELGNAAPGSVPEQVPGTNQRGNNVQSTDAHSPGFPAECPTSSHDEDLDSKQPLLAPIDTSQPLLAPIDTSHPLLAPIDTSQPLLAPTDTGHL